MGCNYQHFFSWKPPIEGIFKSFCIVLNIFKSFYKSVHPLIFINNSRIQRANTQPDVKGTIFIYCSRQGDLLTGHFFPYIIIQKQYTDVSKIRWSAKPYLLFRFLIKCTDYRKITFTLLPELLQVFAQNLPTPIFSRGEQIFEWNKSLS